MTVQAIINGLPDCDARKEFWERMQKSIQKGDYEDVVSKLQYHFGDDDFQKQVVAVALSIVEREIATTF